MAKPSDDVAPPLHIGQELTAIVVDVHDYGVYLQAHGARLLMLIVNAGAQPGVNLRAQFDVGEQCAVQVTSYVEQRGLYLARRLSQ